MSSHYSAFLGPYVRCSVRTKPSTKKIKLCTKKGCRFAKKSNPMSSDNNFCPQCGSAAKIKEVKLKGEVDDTIDQYDVVMATKERLTEFNGEYGQEGIHLFVSNNTKSPGTSISRDEGCYGEIKQFDGEAIDLELEGFKGRHAADLEILYEHYGHDRVKVCWGLLAEVS